MRPIALPAMLALLPLALALAGCESADAPTRADTPQVEGTATAAPAAVDSVAAAADAAVEAATERADAMAATAAPPPATASVSPGFSQ